MLKAFRLLLYYPLYSIVGGIILLFNIILNYILIINSNMWAIPILIISVVSWVYFFTLLHPQSCLQGRLICRVPILENLDGTDSKTCYLTFDDGPNMTFTPKLLKILSDNGIRATFFLIGENIMRAPDMLKKIIEGGHSIGNHSFNHSALIFRSGSFIRKQIKMCEKEIIKAGGEKPYLFRFPHGFRDFRSIHIVKGLGYKIASWSVMPGDWLGLSSNKIAEYVISNTNDGDIILLHDGDGVNPAPNRIKTIIALPYIIKGLRDKGFVFRTLGDVIKDE
ncbi:MAG: polysaccharide deacetylase family protein [bacterium]